MTKFFYLFISLIIGCNSYRLVEKRTIYDYQYPFDSLINPKVFIYQFTDSASTLSFHFQQILKKNNQRILVDVTIGNDNRSDSSIFVLINNKLVLKETYIILKEKSTNNIKLSKGEILKWIDNDENRESIIKFTDEPFTTILTSKSTVDSTMVYRLFGKDLECLRVKGKVTISIRNNSNQTLIKEINKTIELIYAKGFGLINLSMTDDANKSNLTSKLKEIIDFKDYKD
jgi:hypothetical protein